VKTEVVVSGQLALVIGDGQMAAAAIWETLPLEVQAELTVMLARLMARMVAGRRTTPELAGEASLSAPSSYTGARAHARVAHGR
jgi:hypothetical protein